MNARITVADIVDDLCTFVRIKTLEAGVAGRGGPFLIRTENSLPILGAIALDRDVLNSNSDSFYSLLLHEMGYCLGFGTIPRRCRRWACFGHHQPIVPAFWRAHINANCVTDDAPNQSAVQLIGGNELIA